LRPATAARDGKFERPLSFKMTDPLQLSLVMMIKRRWVRVITGLGLVIGSGVTSIAVSSSDPAGAATAPLGAGGEYHALAPQRVLDTRSGINDPAPPGAKALIPGVGQAFEVQLLGQGGLLPVAASAQVLAVAVNITVVGPTEQGYLRVFGKGAAEGDSSLVNFQAGQDVPNMAIVRPGTEGKIVIRLVSEGAAGTAHVLIDVFGWFSTSNPAAPAGARLIPVGPGRIYDSRNPLFGPDPVTAAEVVTVKIRGADSLNPVATDIVPDLPAVVGALVNVTGVNNRSGSQPTFVSVVPETPIPGQWPTTSNLNLRAGQIKPNLVLVPVGADGAIRLFNERGSVDLVVDIVGYLVNGGDPTKAAGRVVPLTSPFRVLDTRQPAFGSAPLAPGRAEDWSFNDFVHDVKINDVPVGNQSALIGNFTATGLQRPGDWFTPVDTFMTAFPTPASSGAPPEASNLNLVENASVPNMALFKYGGDATDPYRVRVYNYNGFVHYLVDVSAVVLAD
jgi:hypothetical protein